MQQKKSPGISREQRLSDEGLTRLEKQLKSGVKISSPVLSQWVKRYGEPAIEIIQKYKPSFQLIDNDDKTSC